jgi:hypothetical protein
MTDELSSVLASGLTLVSADTTSTTDGKTCVCPHCGGVWEMLELACGIFRHAMYKTEVNKSPKHIRHFNPHASLEECEKALREDVIYGCAKPIRITKNGNVFTLTKALFTD